MPSQEEIRAWIDKHLARAPERDDQWCRDVQAIYHLGREEAAAKRAELDQ